MHIDPRRRTRGWVRAGWLAAAAALTAASAAYAQAGQDADAVMAAFVYRFPQFVEWPAEALADRQELEICVAEPDPIGPTLMALIDGEELNGRRLSMRRVSTPGMLDGCHVLFVPSVAGRAGELLAAAEGRPVLTVGESPDFLREGGIILLRVIGRRIRFEVDQEAARRAGLRLSSQLLQLAIAVHGGPA